MPVTTTLDSIKTIISSGVPQSDIAHKCNIPTSTFCEVLHGKYKPNRNMLRKLEWYLKKIKFNEHVGVTVSMTKKELNKNDFTPYTRFELDEEGMGAALAKGLLLILFSGAILFISLNLIQLMR